MRWTIVVGALAALASAIPRPQDDPVDPEDAPDYATPTMPIVLTTSLNIPVTYPLELPTPGPTTTSRKRPHSHWEPIPIFTQECQCNIATVRYPCWATDSLQVSLLRMILKMERRGLKLEEKNRCLRHSPDRAAPTCSPQHTVRC
jgi:hypothetical protein